MATKWDEVKEGNKQAEHALKYAAQRLSHNEGKEGERGCPPGQAGRVPTIDKADNDRRLQVEMKKSRRTRMRLRNDKLSESWTCGRERHELSRACQQHHQSGTPVLVRGSGTTSPRFMDTHRTADGGESKDVSR